MVALGLLVLAGCVAAGIWLARRMRRTTAEGVAAHNAALQAVVAQTALRYVPGAPYDHPMMGRYEAWGQLEGDIEGFHIELGVPPDDDRVATCLSLRPTDGQLRAPDPPQTFKLRSDSVRARLAALGVGSDLERLAARFDRVTLGRASASFVLRAPVRGSFLDHEVATESNPDALLDALSQATALARSLLVPAAQPSDASS
jgi:hypothetical protein